MPNYDYTCLDCRGLFSEFMSFAEYGRKKIYCPSCKSDRVQRRIGRVRTLRAPGAGLDSLEADPAALDGIEEDPRAMAHVLKGMRSELGEETPPEFDEVVDRLDKGQSVDEIEANMPDLGEGGMEDSSQPDF